MSKLKVASLAMLLLIAIIITAGCGDQFFDPTQVGRFRPVPKVNVILDSLGVAEEEPPAWEGAEDPRPVDVMAFETDYVFGSGDIVRISIYELLREGEPYINDYVVTETGRISIPEVGVVQAEGLTESQLEDEIIGILSPALLKDPSVSVILRQSEKRTFSVLGQGVPQPGRYSIPRYDFRLTDALATAGSISQFNISYVYVARKITGREPLTEPQPTQPMPEIPQLEDAEHEMLEIIAPRTQSEPDNRLIMASSAMGDGGDELLEMASPESLEREIYDPEMELLMTPEEEEQEQLTEDEETVIEAPRTEPTGRIEWVWEDGRWIPKEVEPDPTVEEPDVEVAEPLPRPEPMTPEDYPDDFDWDEIGPGAVQTRVIKIPADKLLAGDPRYNVVIRPGDTVHVPVDIIGEFCIMGNVNNQGFINLTGRPMTLKMAIAAAGGLGPLAWPRNVEVIRRIGDNREQIVMVDLEKIARGEQPDFFIKPNDLINVGTHPTSRWRAVLRNAFRATYGFGFIYDRNFADLDFGTRRVFGFIQ